MTQILIYGAYGYTGRLITQEALDQGFSPLLAGRNKEKVESLALWFNLEYTVFDLNQTDLLEEALKKVEVVIHCAGPFSATVLPMVRACLRTKTHYLDITGEYNVFQQVHSLSEEASAAGIMLLPGAGFDVVPSDCLANYLHKQLPEASHLILAFMSTGAGVSRGTAKTMIEGSTEGHRYRKNGQLVTAPLGSRTKQIDYVVKKELSVGISWGDIVTAYYSTGIPNIEVYTKAKEKQIRQMRWMHRLRWLFGMSFVRNFLKGQIKSEGPSEEQRKNSQSYLYGKVWNDHDRREARLVTPNGYTLTAKTAVLIASKILKKNFKTGYQTPASAYGPELILEIEGCGYLS